MSFHLLVYNDLSLAEKLEYQRFKHETIREKLALMRKQGESPASERASMDLDQASAIQGQISVDKSESLEE